MLFEIFFTVLVSFVLFNPATGFKTAICDDIPTAESQHIKDLVESDGLYNPSIRVLYESSSNVENTFLDDYYAPTYFKNLRTNFGNNTKGSCGVDLIFLQSLSMKATESV